ncbi:hypothetical protein LUZ60_016115 [Juncus effusus]|nr:hypothetical protein LUZ60_016115 [Juncus effusus]
MNGDTPTAAEKAVVVEGGGGPPRLSAEELVAKGIVPVKPEYLCPPPVRSGGETENEEAGKEKIRTSVVKDKKSRRELKRERKQNQKSPAHICVEVARTGNADSCQYGDNCRFSHDLDAYIAQKPADLEGKCPFDSEEKVCPYGITCRFLGTHVQKDPSLSKNMPSRKSHEINNFNKDLQKLLWKNKVKFPKADAQLKLLGLKQVNKKEKSESEADQAETDQENLKENDNLESENTEAEINEENLKENDKSEEKCTFDEEDTKENVKTEEKSLFDGENMKGSDKTGEKSTLDEEITNENHKNEEKCTLDEESRPLKKAKSNDLEEITEKTTTQVEIIPKLQLRERKLIDFRGKLYLAPLTTVGNLPFRKLCKQFGADITCGEMAMCNNLLQGQSSEWALLRKDQTEDLFGVQICGAFPDTVTKTVELIDDNCEVDFVDINMGCPIDLVCNKGAGSALLTKPMRMKGVIQAASAVLDKPLTVKVRTGYFEGRNKIDSIVKDIHSWGASALTIHGRSRQQRYSKSADWDYIYKCAQNAPEGLSLIGNGDVCSFEDFNLHASRCARLDTYMIARGALIKPWLFTEIKEQRHWDISSAERFDILKDYVRFGLHHWGSDSKGVETTRHFLLEWLSYTYRYVPVGLLDVVPQKLNWRPPSYFGRNDLETLMASESAADWIRISEMLLGKVPEGFSFAPKHKSNAYDRADNG